MSKALLCSVGVVALVTLTISTALTWILAITLGIQQSSPAGLAAFSAAAINTLGVISFIFVLVRVVFRKNHNAPNTAADKTACMASMIISGIAALLTFALLLWLVFQPINNQSVMGHHMSSFVVAEFAFWALSLIGNILFFAINIIKQDRISHSQTVFVEDVFKVQPETCEMSKHVAAVSYRFGGVSLQQSPPSSPSFSTFSSDSCLSSKPTPVLAHSSSMTPLAPHVAPFPEDTQIIPVPAPDLTQYKHFETEASDRGISAGRPALKITTKLTPIPGSRPASGADVLEGPFLEHNIPEERAHKHAALRSLSVGTLISEFPVADKPKALRRRSNSAPSRRESHIHPLFRTDSSLPPPTPTLGTTVVSPYKGPCISARSLIRAIPRSPLAGNPSTNARHSGDFAPTGGSQHHETIEKDVRSSSDQVRAKLESHVRNFSI